MYKPSSHRWLLAVGGGAFACGFLLGQLAAKGLPLGDVELGGEDWRLPEDEQDGKEETTEYLDDGDEAVDEEPESPERRIKHYIEDLRALFNNPNCRGEVLGRFREHPLAEIRAAAAAAPNAPLSLLEDLLNDPDPAVRVAARVALADRKHVHAH